MRFLSLLFLLSIVSGFPSAQVEPERDYPLKPVAFTNVHFQDEFWAPRIETNRLITIPYCFDKCEETGRLSNFTKAAGRMEGKFQGIRFDDSDVFKVIEGAAYALSVQPDPEPEFVSG